jgi:N-dimethylarginine dimethylaminohydrolase
VTLQSETAPLRRVLLKHARDAFVNPARVEEQWEGLGYLERPDFDAACREYDAFAGLLERLGAELAWMEPVDAGLDSIFVRDASVITDSGVLLCRMGKASRSEEPQLQRRFFESVGFDSPATVAAPGMLEGGDVTWLDANTVAVGRGYRTNASGIEQLGGVVPGDVEIVEVPLPHRRGPGDVFHLMSMLSPLAEDLLLVYSALLPVPFREFLLARGFHLIEVPDEEFDSMACNVLAVAPRVAVAVDGNPETRRRMEAAGVEVHVYEGTEISAKGCGGPTCLTRPLMRGG